MSTEPAAAMTARSEERVAESDRNLPCPISYDPNNGATLLLDGAVFAQIQRVGKMLAASEMVPTHLRNKPADCALVVAQAFRWSLDPLAVAQSTYVVSGKYGYEGKLIAALVNTSGRTRGPLSYAYSGEGGKRRVVVSAQLNSEDSPREISGTVDEWATANEKWRKSPDAMLRYRGAREWARAHMPEIILGIQAEDEIEAAPIVMGGMSAGAAAVAALGSYGPDPLAEKLRAAASPAAPAAPVPQPAVEPTPTREPGEDDDEPEQATLPGAQATASHVDRPATGRRGVR